MPFLHRTSPFEFKLKRDKTLTEQGVNPIWFDWCDKVEEHWALNFFLFRSYLSYFKYMMQQAKV